MTIGAMMKNIMWAILSLSFLFHMPSAHAEPLSAHDAEQEFISKYHNKYYPFFKYGTSNEEGAFLLPEIISLIFEKYSSSFSYTHVTKVTGVTDKGVVFSLALSFPKDDPRHVLGPAWVLNRVAWPDARPGLSGCCQAQTRCPEGSRLPSENESKEFLESFDVPPSFLSTGSGFWTDSHTVAAMPNIYKGVKNIGQGIFNPNSVRPGATSRFSSSVRCVWDITEEMNVD
jgi:hypothetical protein